MAERKLAASMETVPGSDALVADGTRAVAPAILAPPEVPGP